MVPAWVGRRCGECRALEGVFPINFHLKDPNPNYPNVEPFRAVHCFEIFHPFYHHIFFSSPFCRMLLRSKNSKSTALLTLISMPRCVLCCQVFSASFLRADLSPGSPLTSFHSYSLLGLLLVTLTVAASAHLLLACLGIMGKINQWGLVL